ncbi:MAG: gamma-glutamylcyclotransferase [Prochloraceae cyanobacterium]|nr:gamma-glutamylcyclotransferase [Prochloraceae cyanobacterium]
MIRFFVYGTLKPGEVNYQLYCSGKAIEERIAYAKGKLFDLPLGYPAMTFGDGWVEGYLLSFSEESILVTLDLLEDYDEKRSPQENEYYRQLIPVYDSSRNPLGKSWSYLMNSKKIEQLSGVIIPSGKWLNRR